MNPFRSLFRRSSRSPVRPVRRRPRLEALEERCLLSSGTWQEIKTPTGTVGGVLELLPTGNVLVQDYNSDNWYQLQPDSSGNYAVVNFPANLVSTTPTDASGANSRNTADAVVLPNGDIFELGGEYSSTGKSFLNSGQIYDPTTNQWTLTKPAPIIWDGQPYLGDTPMTTLPDGTVLVGNNNGPAVHVGGDLNTLNAAAGATDTTLTVFAPYMTPTPSVPFQIDVEHEIMTVTGVSNGGTTWTVTRGQDGTTAAAHGDGASIDLISSLTAAVPNATATTIHVADTASFPSLNPTTLTAAIGATDTTITVASTAGFPTASPLYAFPIMVGQEIMTVTAVSGDTLTVIRGTQGTAAVGHANGATATTPYYIQVDQEIMFVTGVNGTALTVERGAQGTTAVSHANGGIVHLSSDYGEMLDYNPTSDTWTTLPQTADKLADDSSFEESWVKIPGTAGDILSYSNNATFEYNQSQAEYYNPATQTWTATGAVPVILTENVFSNEIGPALALPNGQILQISGNADTALYTPSTNSWTTGPQIVTALTTLSAAIPGPNATTIHVASGTVAPTAPFYIEIDQEVMEVTVVSGTAWTVVRGQYFSTAVAHSNGAAVSQYWVAGDDPAAELPDGEIIFNAGQQIETAPTTMFDYNPTTNTITPMDTSVMPTDMLTFLQNNADDNTSMLMLPTGQLLMSNGVNRQLYIYTPSGAGPAPSSLPTVTGVTANGDGTFTLSGKQLNGISEGAFYGDDEGMSENYPVIRLTAADGTVAYADTFNWSSTAVATGSTPETTKFTLPADTPPGTYQLTVSAAGISSQPFSFTVTPAEATSPSLFTLAPDGSLWQYGAAGFEAPTWSELSPAGTILSESPSLDATGTPEVFAVPIDHSLWVHSSAGWTELSPGGTILQASASPTNTVFVVAVNNSLYQHTAAGWALLSPGGTILSISAGVDASGHAEVFAIPIDHSLYRYDSGWALLSPGGTILSATASGNAVFVIAADTSFWENAGGWSELSPGGTILSASPGTDAGGAPAAFVLAINHSLYEHTTAGWTLLSPGGTIVQLLDSEGADVFVEGADGALWQYDGAAWTRLGFT
ncbi:MAG TPA: hypothetical protein VMS17_12480 [Gemmataceae bacterium]|nr:hypothetical protein [Gemmataceae bacterium]